MNQFSQMFENNLTNSQVGYKTETNNKMIIDSKNVKMTEQKRERMDDK